KDLYSVPKIFTAEALMAVRAFIVEEPAVPARLGAGPTLAGLTLPPALRGYVAAVAKPSADVALASPRRDPLLATWRYGLGRTVAFTSDDGLRWTAPWASWPDVARFWSQAIRWTLPEDTAGLHLAAAMDASASEARAVLDARRPGGAPWDGLDVSGEVAGLGGEPASARRGPCSPARRWGCGSRKSRCGACRRWASA